MAAHSELEKISRLLREDAEALDADVKSQAIRAATDAFYTLVPTKNGRAALPLINDHKAVSKKLEQLEALASGDAASDKPGESDEVAAFLRKTGLVIKPVDESSPEFEALGKYVADSAAHYPLNLKKAFELGGTVAEAEGGNRRLTFHGTRRVNLAGILSGGLKLISFGHHACRSARAAS